MIRLARLLKETVLTLGAVFGALCVVALIAAVFFGVTPLVFRSGSMAPAIRTGALALAQKVPASEIRVGDVVSAVNAQGTRVTHRVVAIESRGGGRYAMTMRGDANEAVDPTDYLVSSADRILWHLDGLGYLVQWAQKPGVMFVGGALVGGMAVSSFKRRITRNGETSRNASGDPVPPVEPADGSRSAAASRSRSLPASTALLGVVPLVPILAMAMVPSSPTWAAFADTATASAGFRTLTKAQLQPVFNGCSASAGLLTVTWSDPTGAVPDRGYSVQSTSSSATIPAGSTSYSWSTPFSGDDLVTITAEHFTTWSASIGVRASTGTDGSVTCSLA